jgi:hypothetical protein
MVRSIETICVSSSEMIHSPGLWRWFLNAKRTERKQWCVDFLRAFTNDRLSAAKCRAYLQGKITISTEEEAGEHGPSLILRISPEAKG